MKKIITLSLCLISLSSFASMGAESGTVQNLVAIKSLLTEISTDIKLHNANFENELQINESKCFWNNNAFTIGAIHEVKNSLNDKKTSYICRKQNGTLSWIALTADNNGQKP